MRSTTFFCVPSRRMASYTASAALLIARNAESGYSTRRTPTDASSCAVNSGVLPNSVMFASTGTCTADGELPVFVERGQRLGEDHVRAGLDVLRGASTAACWPFHRVRIGARHDDERIVRAAIDRGLDAIDHLVGGHQLLAGPMAAALGRDLIFEVHAAGAGLDELRCRCARC